MDYPPAQEKPALSGPLLHFERGARVLGPDGQLGTLRQMIVSQDTGDLRRLVVRSEAGMDIELPADQIVSASGDEIHLTIGLRDLADHPELALPYDAERYTGGDPEQLASGAGDPERTGTLLTEAQLSAMRGIATEPGGDVWQLAPLAAVGMLVGGAIGGLAVIFSRRRAATIAAQDDGAQSTWQAGAQTARAGLMRLRDRSQTLGTNLSTNLGDTSQAVGASLSDTSQTALAAMSDTLANAGMLAAALLASARALWPSRQVAGQATAVTSAASAAPGVIAERVRQPARAARQAAMRQGRAAGRAAARQGRSARRGARRFARRVRWLRNGLILGAVLGVLYAPEPGREARQRLMRTLRNIPWLDRLLEPASDTATVARDDTTTGKPGASSEANLWGAPPERAATRFDLPPTIH